MFSAPIELLLMLLLLLLLLMMLLLLMLMLLLMMLLMLPLLLLLMLLVMTLMLLMLLLNATGGAVQLVVGAGKAVLQGIPVWHGHNARLHRLAAAGARLLHEGEGPQARLRSLSFYNINSDFVHLLAIPAYQVPGINSSFFFIRSQVYITVASLTQETDDLSSSNVSVYYLGPWANLPSRTSSKRSSLSASTVFQF